MATAMAEYDRLPSLYTRASASCLSRGESKLAPLPLRWHIVRRRCLELSRIASAERRPGLKETHNRPRFRRCSRSRWPRRWSRVPRRRAIWSWKGP